MLKGILIDPNAKEIKEVKIPADHRDIALLLGGYSTQWLPAPFPERFQDEEYRIFYSSGSMDIAASGSNFFKFDGLKPVAGKGVVVGWYKSGSPARAMISVEDVKALVSFLTFEEVKALPVTKSKK